ncbi:MAG TPA: putative zinc-binding protein [Verrucomicrobiae bacterium]|nr:putative zinc-binding protein [Verrucomicrobiae bacterium]
MDSSQKPKLPLVYSCSGASSAAQMANHLAVRLDRLGVAEMSCIAGVGGDVRPLVKTAKSGRPIIAIDGCPLNCVAAILRRHGIEATKHYVLSDRGVTKRPHEDYSQAEAARVLRQILEDPEFPKSASAEGTRLAAEAGACAASGYREYASSPCSMPPIED